MADSDGRRPAQSANRGPPFAVDDEKRISWDRPATGRQPRKLSKVEATTGLTEHRTNIGPLQGPVVEGRDY